MTFNCGLAVIFTVSLIKLQQKMEFFGEINCNLNMPVTESIQRLLQQGKMKLFSEKERIYPTITGKYPISVFFPISKKDEFGETLGLLLCAKNQQPFSEMDLGCAKMTAAAISRYIQQNYERKVT